MFATLLVLLIASKLEVRRAVKAVSAAQVKRGHSGSAGAAAVHSFF